MSSTLVTRQYYGSNIWVALGIIIFGAILIFFLFSCFSARRRRKLGRNPYYGTGWAGRPVHGQAQYNPGYQATQQQTGTYQAPPAYGQEQGGYYGQNQGYFGGRQTERDVEMQPPQQVYGGDNFAPPAGPPPAKK
ncbi:hypothetical protein H2200_009929 [Cladophialophora chaetospira]|uniref:Uncharacterized protein n=1 Tax=Cladophialophora chaetospira TaxID=386627 RepID=A0AA39CEJ8_9EURO|nr:hypothetical protein H2200_009929 [Cladophialophora chaetospira]